MRNLLDKLLSIRNCLHAMTPQQWFMRSLSFIFSLVIMALSLVLLSPSGKSSTADSTVFIGANLSIIPAAILLGLVLLCSYQCVKPQTQLAIAFYPLIGIIFWIGAGAPLWIFAVIALCSIGCHTLWAMSAHTPAYSKLSKELHTKRMRYFALIMALSLLLLGLSWLLYILMGNLALQLSAVSAAYPALAIIFWSLGVSAVAIFILVAVRNALKDS